MIHHRSVYPVNMNILAPQTAACQMSLKNKMAISSETALFISIKFQ
jgi:hypothetical protein